MQLQCTEAAYPKRIIGAVLEMQLRCASRRIRRLICGEGNGSVFRGANEVASTKKYHKE
jgi:hypothetical protein